MSTNLYDIVNSIDNKVINLEFYVMSLYDNIDNATVSKEIRITDKDRVMCEEIPS